MKNILSYSGTQPSGEDYSECTDIMSKVDDLAPSDSHVDAVIKLLTDGTYHTTIAINAICGNFQSQAKTRTLVSSLKQAQRSMLAILAEWKGTRFENPA